jgi:glycine dehydrogenase subunit 1
VRGPKPAAEILEKLRTENGIIGGLSLSKYYPGLDNDFLVCVTETKNKEAIDELIAALK